jgi:hypothetical protein
MALFTEIEKDNAGRILALQTCKPCVQIPVPPKIRNNKHRRSR